MTAREKLFAFGFISGVLVMIATGGFAFYLENRLVTIHREAEAELRREKLLDAFSDHLRDLRRHATTFILLRDLEALTAFEETAASYQEITRDLEAEARATGKTDEVTDLIAETYEWVEAYRQIVYFAQIEGPDTTLEHLRELVEAGPLSRIIASAMDLDRTSMAVVAEQNRQINDTTRTAIVTIGLLLVVATGLIVASGGMMLHYYVANKSLLDRTTALNRDLEESRKEMESIVSFVSHDLRAPLINVKGFADAVRDDYRRLTNLLGTLHAPAEIGRRVDAILKDSTPEAISFIETAADSMERLIKTMVKVARAGQLPVHPVRVEVDAMIAGILRDFDYRIKQNDAKVQVEPLPYCIADTDQVRQVFSNIIDNAIKYRRPDRAPRINITGRVDRGRSIYCVEDNGIGIAREALGSIFQIYYQAGNMSAGGEGLGLAIAKKMVGHNGGRLYVESQLHEGSRFFIELNAAAQATGAAAPCRPATKKNPGRRYVDGRDSFS